MRLRAHKAEIIAYLSSLEPTSASTVEVPADWTAGITRLGSLRRPRTVPPKDWSQLNDDSVRFIDRRAARAGGAGLGSCGLVGLPS